MEYKSFSLKIEEKVGFKDRAEVTYYGSYKTKGEFIEALEKLMGQKIRTFIYEKIQTGGYTIGIYKRWLDKNPDKILIEEEKWENNKKVIHFYDAEKKPIAEENEFREMILGKMEEGKERHISYGTINLSSASARNVKLFGSSILHNGLIMLTINTAYIMRDLSNDWIYADRPIIEIEMSYTQFSEAITSFNKSAGVPCTITYTKDLGHLPEPPFIDKKMQFDNEFQKQIEMVSSKSSPFFAEIYKVLEKSNMPKRDKEAIKNELQMIKQSIDSNLPFIKKQFTEQMDKTLLEVRQDIEAFVENKIRSIGLEGFKKELLQLQSPSAINLGE